ncbi:peptidase C48, SUMO/sentrin/Ubl1 [Tanacetum coccineum]
MGRSMNLNYMKVKSVCSFIEEKLKFISDEKAELEDILRMANTQFSNDEDVRVLYEKYVGVFKETVLLEEEQVHVDDFHPVDGEKFRTDSASEKQTAVETEDVDEEVEDLFVWPSKVPVDVHHLETPEGRVTRSSPKKRFSKPPAYLSSPFMNKKTVVIAQVKRLEFVLGNSVLSMQGYDLDCGETYKSKYKDAYELLKSFSRYLCENNHPVHEKVAKVKPRIPKLKCRTTKNHVDCGVFLMIHMESYISEPAARWDVGLCTESHMQDSLLRRMRYKIAAKILLHELNIHSQKMFDLAYKFKTENDEHTRISIIVNAIKNKSERDPAKTKTVVEIQEEDALKNK